MQTDAREDIQFSAGPMRDVPRGGDIEKGYRLVFRITGRRRMADVRSSPGVIRATPSRGGKSSCD